MPKPGKLVDLSFKGTGEYWAAPLATGARRAAARAADERISGLAFHTAPAAVKPPGGSARPSAPEAAADAPPPVPPPRSVPDCARCRTREDNAALCNAVREAEERDETCARARPVVGYLPVRVVCGDKRGTMRPAAYEVRLPGGLGVTPGQFERLGGKGSAKKWAHSIKAMLPSGRTQPIQRYCEQRGIELVRARGDGPGVLVARTVSGERIVIDGDRGGGGGNFGGGVGRGGNDATPKLAEGARFGEMQPVTDWVKHAESGLPADWRMHWVRRIISHSGQRNGDWYYFPPNSTVRFRSTSEVRHALTGSDEFSAANCSAAAAKIGAKMEDFHVDRKEMKHVGPLKGGMGVMGAHGADRSNPYLAFMDAELKKLHAENSLLPKAERMDPQSIMRRAAKHYRARGGAVGGAAGGGAASGIVGGVAKPKETAHGGGGAAGPMSSEGLLTRCRRIAADLKYQKKRKYKEDPRYTTFKRKVYKTVAAEFEERGENAAECFGDIMREMQKRWMASDQRKAIQEEKAAAKAAESDAKVAAAVAGAKRGRPGRVDEAPSAQAVTLPGTQSLPAVPVAMPPLAQVPAEAPSAKRTKLASWSPPTDVPIWPSASMLLSAD